MFMRLNDRIEFRHSEASGNCIRYYPRVFGKISLKAVLFHPWIGKHGNLFSVYLPTAVVSKQMDLNKA